MKVLVVEDDVELAEVLGQTLSKQHYQVAIATDGEAGWELVELFEYDLVLLDLHLPKLDGINFCRQLRASGHDVPVLLITAEDTRTSKIAGLDAGADDYVIKPLDLDELLARMRALLRRGRTESPPVLTWGPISINPSSCEVFCQEHRLHLTSKEYELLELFLRYPHRIFSLSALIERFWSLAKIPSENAVWTHLKSLQNKLRHSDVDQMIETVYGLGYRLRSEPSDTNPKLQALTPPNLNPPGGMTSTVAPTPESDRMAESSREVWERHQQKYLDLITAISQALQALQAQEASTILSLAEKQSMLERSRNNAHTLKGSLGCFGFTTASQIAAQIEQILATAPEPESEQIAQLPGLIKQLHQSLQVLNLPTIEKPPSADQSQSKIYQWLIIDNDKELIEELISQASIWGIQTHIAATLSEAREALMQHSLDVVMLGLNSAVAVEEGLTFLSELTQQQPSLPVIVATDQDTLADRVNVLRAGACAFLQKSVTAAQVFETVIHSLTQNTLPVARILALDDNPQILQCLKQVLLPWGFQLTLVSDPVQFWDVLEQAPPDLLILDIEMPNFNGLELCQVVRSDPALSQLPILFLSAHTEPEVVRRMFEVGGDDYLSKPIIGPELVARILNRLERVRLHRTLAEIDNLTGLSRRQQSVEALNRLLKLANRQQTTLCFSLLDLDRFKQVNDHHGHDVGDQVLKTLGDYLRRTFRGQDVIARWGGEEFVVGLYAVSKEVATQRLRNLLQAFNRHVFWGKDNGRFHVSFSGGVAMYPQDGKKLQSLYRQADQALYSAKAAGRNQILPVPR
ncbi:MAG: response regulator [Cyanobacteria bacterium P01_F01_bin.86]